MSSMTTNWLRGLAMFGIVLGSVHVSRPVVANGAALPAGTYQVRVADDMPTPVVGQAPDSARWVEFVKNGKVVGREMASVISAADMGAIAKGAQPKANGSLVQLLNGGDYLRVWINKSGTNYIINLPVSK